MRSWIQSLLAFFAFGVGVAGCSRTEAPPAVPTDVTLTVPGMF
jgi:hypothetical protein